MSSWHRRSSHDAMELDRRVAQVRVIDPHHPLYGSCLPVSNRRSGRGPNLIVVRLPDGRERSIRRSATDLVGGSDGPPQAAKRPMHISVRTLLPLANHLRAVLASRHANVEGGPLLDRTLAGPQHGVPGRSAGRVASSVGATPGGEAATTGTASRPASPAPAAGAATRSGEAPC